MAQRVGSRSLRSLDPTLCLLDRSFLAFVWCYGTEFTSRVLDRWAYENHVTLHFITPGRPMENGYIESFHGKFREECLNQHWFLTLDDARETIENWRLDYNRVRPHSALGYLTPEEFRDRAGYANVESKQRFPLLEWSAACSVGRLFWSAGGFSWKFRQLAST